MTVTNKEESGGYDVINKDMISKPVISNSGVNQGLWHYSFSYVSPDCSVQRMGIQRVWGQSLSVCPYELSLTMTIFADQTY